MSSAIEFLKRASIGQGRIVSSGDLCELQIAEAKALDRFFVDEDTGLGWAILPWDLTTDKDNERHKEMAKND